MNEISDDSTMLHGWLTTLLLHHCCCYVNNESRTQRIKLSLLNLKFKFNSEQRKICSFQQQNNFEVNVLSNIMCLLLLSSHLEILKKIFNYRHVTVAITLLNFLMKFSSFPLLEFNDNSERVCIRSNEANRLNLTMSRKSAKGTWWSRISTNEQDSK